MAPAWTAEMQMMPAPPPLLLLLFCCVVLCVSTACSRSTYHKYYECTDSYSPSFSFSLYHFPFVSFVFSLLCLSCVFSFPPSEVDSLRARLRRKHHIFHLSLFCTFLYVFFLYRSSVVDKIPSDLSNWCQFGDLRRSF